MKIIRIIGVIILAGVFSVLAFVLYQKQKQHISFVSFQLPAPSTSIFVPDLDRLLRRLDSPESFSAIETNQDLKTGFSQLWNVRDTTFGDQYGRTCFLSYTATDFMLVFKNQDLSVETIISTLKNVFKLNAAYAEGMLMIGTQNYHLNQFGAFLAISSLPITPNHVEELEPQTNADYVVIKDSLEPIRYIIAYDQLYKVWDVSGEVIKGRAIPHDQFIRKIPMTFEQLAFYGSTRFQEDKNTFFNNPGEEDFSWVNQGVLIFKKGDFEIMMAPQNDQRDLKLILEEQTLANLGDTVQIEHLTVKNFEIMPFTSQFKWTEAIPELSQPLTHYTEFENFNVLANSLEALQWYLAEIQTANLLYQDEAFMLNYLRSAPYKTHKLHLVFNGDLLQSESATWIEKTKQIRTETTVSISGSAPVEEQDGRSIEIPFQPKYIIPYSYKGSTSLLIAADQKLALINRDGEILWQTSWSSQLLSKPELIDLEKDGKMEIALFAQSEFLVFTSEGKLAPNLSIKTAQPLKGGMCVNYDQAYDYRFFLVYGSQVVCYNEQGQVVNGWKFGGLTVPLTGSAFYTQITGIDFLTFKDVNSKVYLLNRRGENRFGNNVVSKLPNESTFVIGKSDELVHKLGYGNQYIYTRFLKDGYTDSLKLDIQVNAISARWMNPEDPILVIEEPNRVILFNSFGYLEGEVLKPKANATFIGIENTISLHYLFYDNSNNSLYLLNKDGKISFSGQTNNPFVYGITASQFYTTDGLKIYEQKIK